VIALAPAGITSHVSAGVGGPVECASIVQVDAPAVTVNSPDDVFFVYSTPTSGSLIGAVALAAGDDARPLYPLGPSVPASP
jgi:hypothetical protein